MQIVKQIWGKFQRVAELTLGMLENGIDFMSFQEELRRELDGLGQGILKEVLEAKDAYLREHREERPGWQIQRRNDSKEVLTIFGLVNYERTYYRHKETGERAYLIDRLVGYGVHARVDPLVKAQALETAVELSYRKSGEEAGRGNRGVVLSGEAVKKVIHSFTPEELPELPKEKRRLKTLYVEADEDHVAGQDKKSHLPRLVYIHEGKEKVGKGRFKLKRPYYLAGLYPDTDELWLKVLSYIEEHYGLPSLERIYLCGDGDKWIRKGLEFLPKSVFVLDLFHLDKYLVAALGRESEGYRQIWAALREGDQVKVQAILKKAGKAAASPARKEAVRDCRRYIRRNWDGIMAYRLYPEAQLGVSAEGHVSHILAARMSSRPMAWSAKGADRMAQLRAMKANRVSLRERYVAQCREELKPFKICQTAVAQERQRLKKVVGEVFDNLPALRGPVTQLTRALKALSQNSSLVW
ncbi:MAG: ISLre2 family transposase [Firmicutes bacterium]|nr:ISLre2 family transposase [Bacillota bacterium]